MRKILLLSMLCIASVGLSVGQDTPPSGRTGQTGGGNQSGSYVFKGYCNVTDLGLLIGSPRSSTPAPFSFMTINGWHFTEQFAAGLGVGVEFLAGSYMPIVLDARYYVRNTNFSPFFFLQGGYALPLDAAFHGGTIYYDRYWPDGSYSNEPYKAWGGLILNPGFGIRSMFSSNFGVVFSVGYRYEKLFYTSDPDREMIADYNRLMLKIGIIFR